MKFRYILTFIPLIMIIIAFIIVNFLLDVTKAPKYYIKIDESNIENVIDLIEYLEIEDFKEAISLEMTEVKTGLNANHNEYYVTLNYISTNDEEKIYKSKNGFQVNHNLNEKVYKAVHYIREHAIKQFE